MFGLVCQNVFGTNWNLEKNIIFIQTNYFIIFTYSSPVLLVPGFRQVG
jgi:hypothetical protein